MAIEADVQAVLLGARSSQQVEVLAGGQRLATWAFTPERNRGIRSVRIPLAALRTEQGLPAVTVEFRPQAVASPHDLDAGNADTRPLGLGLLRIRQRVAE